MQGLLAALIVFPIAAVVHAPGVHAHLSVHWPIVITLIPLACITMSSLGLLLGTAFEARNLGLMFGFVVLPLTFLGGTYYQWTKLAPVQVAGIHWLQIVVLVNPLIYINEGMRPASPHAAHMHLYVVYPVLLGFCAVFLTLRRCANSAGGCCPSSPARARLLLDQLDPVAIGIFHKAEPRAALANRVGRLLGLDALLG